MISLQTEREGTRTKPHVKGALGVGRHKGTEVLLHQIFQTSQGFKCQKEHVDLGMEAHQHSTSTWQQIAGGGTYLISIMLSLWHHFWRELECWCNSKLIPIPPHCPVKWWWGTAGSREGASAVGENLATVLHWNVCFDSLDLSTVLFLWSGGHKPYA